MLGFLGVDSSTKMDIFFEVLEARKTPKRKGSPRAQWSVLFGTNSLKTLKKAEHSEYLVTISVELSIFCMATWLDKKSLFLADRFLCLKSFLNCWFERAVPIRLEGRLFGLYWMNSYLLICIIQKNIQNHLFVGTRSKVILHPWRRTKDTKDEKVIRCKTPRLRR